MKHIETSRTLPLALVAVLATGAGFLLHQQGTAGPEPAARDSARELGRAFRDVARHISPSVVSVLAVREPSDSPARFHAIDPHQELFRGPLGRFFGEEGAQILPWSVPLPSQGQGTGVIVDADGIIATNNHVVNGATRVEVRLADGRKLAAEVVGTDPETDLAILRVKEKGLPAAEIGDSTALEPGDWVVAVGNPFGLDHTVTVGVVSALGRSGLGLANPSYENFIQTDAAINPGNSGGPLLDLDGRVVGINTAIRSSSGGSDGISFAIPSATLKNVLPELVSDGRVSRGYLGVSLQDLTPELSRSFGVAEAKGALISEVVAGTPAARAGLRSGDIVTALAGAAVTSSRELSTRVAALEPGREVELTLLRDGASARVTVELGERPGRDELARRADSERPSNDFGMRLAPVPESLARSRGLDGGALVREVVPGSPADEADLRPGDVIVSVEKYEVDSADEAARRLREADDSVRLLVRGQDGGARWVFLERRAGE
jgi:serine protease Do